MGGGKCHCYAWLRGLGKCKVGTSHSYRGLGANKEN
jgi:hypothetical protein